MTIYFITWSKQSDRCIFQDLDVKASVIIKQYVQHRAKAMSIESQPHPLIPTRRSPSRVGAGRRGPLDAGGRGGSTSPHGRHETQLHLIAVSRTAGNCHASCHTAPCWLSWKVDTHLKKRLHINTAWIVCGYVLSTACLNYVRLAEQPCIPLT